MHIPVNHGLDIPIGGKPEGAVQALKKPAQIALNLRPFSDTKFKLHVKREDRVKKGQLLAHDKSCEKRQFLAPAAGTIVDITRGYKRHIIDIIIAVDAEEEEETLTKIDPVKASREQILESLSKGGMLPFIRQRPFDLFADPEKAPRAIFVQAVESALFTPPAELQAQGHEKAFQVGLEALQKLTDGKVHMVHREGSAFFEQFKGIDSHTVSGPHPAANPSLHIQKIDPVLSQEDVVWTLSARSVVAIGYVLKTGRYYCDLVISIAGPAIVSGRTGYFQARQGYPIESLLTDRIAKRSDNRFISGDPLMGTKVTGEGFLGFNDTVFCVIPEPEHREFLHFFRLGVNKYSFSRTYLSGHLDNSQREYPFTTNQHGEKRAFVEGKLYNEVTPLSIDPMTLVKAVMAEDFELAETLGLLEVAAEDFALPTFVCPSKIEMCDIIKEGLKDYAQEVLS